MSKPTSRILHYLTTAILVIAGVLGAQILPTPVEPPTASAACLPTPPEAVYGKAAQTVNAPTAGTYRVWSRIKAPNTTANSFYLQVDNGCTYNIGDAASTPVNSWTWVNYQDGSSAATVDVTLSAGAHTLTYIGREPDVQVDRVLILSDINCVPTGLGDNCTISDNTAPVVSVVAPTNGSTVQGTVKVQSTVYDVSPIAKVEFYVDGALKHTVQGGSAYEYGWDTKSVGNGTHSLQVKAYDTVTPANVGTSSVVSVNVNNPPAVGQLDLQSSLIVDKPTLGAGETVSATAVYKNNTAWAVTVKDIQLSARIPGSTTVQPTYFTPDTTGPYTVQPGASIVFTGKHTVAPSEPTGTYWAFAQYIDSASVIHTDTTETSFVVTAPDTTAPTIAITSPAAGAEILAGNTVQIAIDAADNSAVTKVEVAIDNVTKGTLTATPYSYSWNTGNVTAGQHTITARAFDAAGNVTASEAVSVTVVIPPTPAPTPPPANQGTGLKAVYYDRLGFKGTSFTRIDPQINFDWGTGAPVPGFGADTFSSRWTGYITVPVTGTYTFTTITDDGVRLWVNSKRLIAEWHDHATAETNSRSITLEAGKRYPIKMEHYENQGRAVAKLLWSSNSIPRQAIPQANLYPQ